VSDASVHAALRSDIPLVVVEAPGGCGKTYQGAEYAKDIAKAIKPGRLLILTHTHAACSVFGAKTRELGSSVLIRTIDGFVTQLTAAYHLGLGLPADTAGWARDKGDVGYAELAVKAAALLKRYPSIAAAVARRYPVIICDEHQDCSGDQHAVIAALHAGGAKLRIFADPMQKIFKDDPLPGGCLPCDWNFLKGRAGAFEELDVPHRWTKGDPELGKWILGARESLKNGGRVNLARRPSSVIVVRAENLAKKNGEFQLASADRKGIDVFVNDPGTLLILSHWAKTASALRGLFGRRVPLWEGHTRKDLTKLVRVLEDPQTPAILAGAVVNFMGKVAIGFSPSAFGKAFREEVAKGCLTKRKAGTKPARIQVLAGLLLNEPDFRGVSKVLRTIGELRTSDPAFKDVKIDHAKEFWEAARLGDFATVQEGFDTLTQRRTYARPSPPAKAISTIHKSKGLECDCVVLLACDDKQLPDTAVARCLLYVALSRPMKRLMIVVPKSKPSPLFQLP
jgi:UvrD-like helicase C-terminal domain/UvrD/REP helicase N-terminal domain